MNDYCMGWEGRKEGMTRDERVRVNTDFSRIFVQWRTDRGDRGPPGECHLAIWRHRNGETSEQRLDDDGNVTFRGRNNCSNETIVPADV